MADKIYGITSHRRTPSVRNYTPQEMAKKMQEMEKEISDRQLVRDYLAKYPNPDHLSFQELLDLEIKNNNQADDDVGYELNISSQH